MTIGYRDGKTIEGVTLARTANTMRVAVKGCEDAAEFINVHGTWVSEDCEPVTIEYGPRRNPLARLSEAQFNRPPGTGAPPDPSAFRRKGGRRVGGAIYSAASRRRPSLREN